MGRLHEVSYPDEAHRAEFKHLVQHYDDVGAQQVRWKIKIQARYRNPEEDLPLDFDLQRERYYTALSLPVDANAFIARVRQDLSAALHSLDQTLPKNKYVNILQKKKGWIALSPLEAQPEPVNLVALKTELGQRWPMTSLLDMLKETDLRVGFTDAFKSVTAWGLALASSA